MIEEFAVWLGCNPTMQDPVLCAMNTVLILPGLAGMMLLFMGYMIGIPFLLFSLLKRVYFRLRGK